MQNTTKFLEMAAYILMFCMAVIILLFYNRSLTNLITSSKNHMSNQNIFYENERSNEEIQEGKVTYAELISTLDGNLDYDVQINNMTILKVNYNYQVFDYSTIPQAEYSKSYQYDAFGNIVMVVYKG